VEVKGQRPRWNGSGVTGVFFRALAITVAASLITSLGLALNWTPTFSHYFVHQELDAAAPPIEGLSERERLLAAEEASLGPRFRNIVDFYEKALRFGLGRPLWMGIFAVVLIAASHVGVIHIYRQNVEGL